MERALVLEGWAKDRVYEKFGLLALRQTTNGWLQGEGLGQFTAVESKKHGRKTMTGKGCLNGTVVHCINGHTFKAFGEGDEPHGMKETYVTRPCPVCEIPTDIKWPLGRELHVVPV